MVWVPVIVTVVWNGGVQCGIQRWQKSQGQHIRSVKTHVNDHAHLVIILIGWRIYDVTDDWRLVHYRLLFVVLVFGFWIWLSPRGNTRWMKINFWNF